VNGYWDFEGNNYTNYTSGTANSTVFITSDADPTALSTTTLGWGDSILHLPPHGCTVPSGSTLLRIASHQAHQLFFSQGSLLPSIGPTDPDVRRRIIVGKTHARQAESKARKLFIDTFGENRFFKMMKEGFLELLGISGSRYRLRPGKEIEVSGPEGSYSPIHRLCVHLRGGIPKWDTLIAQALFLQAGKEGEDRILEVANRMQYYPPRQQVAVEYPGALLL
jgi:hypothetical protein